jgi:hypothetical protein
LSGNGGHDGGGIAHGCWCGCSVEASNDRASATDHSRVMTTCDEQASVVVVVRLFIVAFGGSMLESL